MSRLRPIGHEDRLSLVEHLDELRNRLIVSLVVLGVAFAVCYWQNDWLLTTINKPLQSTRSISADSSKRSPLEDTAVYGLKTARAQRLTLPVLATQKRINDLLASKLDLTVAQQALLAKQNRQLDDANPRHPRRRGGGAAQHHTPARHAGGDRAVRDDLHGGRLRRPAAGAALPALPGLRLRPAGLQPPREEGRAAADAHGAGALPLRRGLRLLRRLTARDPLPADLQRRQLRHPHPRHGLLQVRDRPHRAHRAALPDPGRRAGRHAAGDHQRAPARQEPRLRDPGHRGGRRGGHADAGSGDDAHRDGAAAGPLRAQRPARPHPRAPPRRAAEPEERWDLDDDLSLS